MRKFFATALALVLSLGCLSAQQPQVLPLDPEVRVGTLENGFTYYLRHNNWPENRTSFYLAQRVGSLQEEESQLGLAHFLEHMCFNGTEHFPGNEVWGFVQRNGLNNNAETGLDQTVYFIDNVPSTIGAAGLDTCLIIMADWAHGLTLDASEINKEREVIHGEYRLHMQGMSRLLITELANIYPGRYGLREPIGTMEVVDNFEHQELVNYYKKWYNPQNQALIVVGDIDVDQYEQKIKDLFGGLTSNEGAGTVEEYHLDPIPELYYSMAKDKDLQTTIMSYNIHLPELPREYRNTADAQVMNYVFNAASSVLNYRLSDLTPDANCPWLVAQSGINCYVSKKFREFIYQGYPKEGKQLETFALMLTELRRLVQYGITPGEYERFVQEYTQQIDNFEANKDKRDNSVVAQELCQNFYFGDAALAPDMEIMLNRQFTQMLPLEAINQMIAQLICTTGENTTFWCWEHEAEGATYVTKEQLQEVFAAAQAAEIEAPADNSIKEPLLSKLPKAGKIKSEKPAKFGFTELTLSNGVKVFVRKSDIEPNSVNLSASSKSGSNQYDISDFSNYELAGDVPYTVGGWNSRQLQKLTAGKRVATGMTLRDDHHIVSAFSGSKDLETMFQLVYLYFTDLGKDEEMYPNLIEQLRTLLPNRKTNSDAIFADSVNAVLNSHDPRFRNFEVEDIDNANYDRMLQMMQTPMKNAANYCFIIAGDYDEAELRQYVCQYLASLPSKKKADTFGTYKEQKVTQDVVCDFRAPITEPKVLSKVHWMNYKMAVSPENIIMAGLVSNMLTNDHFKVLREEMSACYTPHAERDFSLHPDNHYIQLMATTTGFKPELADEALAYTSKSIRDLAVGCTAEQLVKAQETMINNMREARDTQLYVYMDAIRRWDDYGYDQLTIYEDFINAQTPETVKAWLNDYLKDAVEVKVVARPE